MFDNCNTWLFPILWFLGAFILGYLLRQFIGRSRHKKDNERITEFEADNQSPQGGSAAYKSGGNTEELERELDQLKARVADYKLQVTTMAGQLKDSRRENEALQERLAIGAAGAAGVESTPADEDDLKRIEGIGPNVEKILNRAGIGTWSELSTTQPSRLREILDAEGGRFQYLDPTSWPQQAALAKEMKWRELDTLQEELIGGVYYGPVGQYKDADDLKRIEGIGPRVEGLLNNSGIHSWSQLANTEPNRLKEILSVAGGRFKDIDPSSWPQQASMAASGKWEELDILQDELIGGVRVTDSGMSPQAPDTTQKDDLKIIEGLGNQAEKVLNAEGIDTYEELSLKTPEELREILDNHGDRFVNLDPTSWPQQAWLAASGRWEDLEELQDDLIGGLYVGPVGPEIGDDLKRIESIGPRIEGLLSQAGINTYRELADADPDRIDGILDAAGHPYSEMDTSTWKPQAYLAAEGKWDELYDLQNEIILGIYRKPGDTDDLKMIEGIGPKTETILNNAGIKTFEDLQNTPEERLREILDDAGFSLDIINPGTWGQQAGLAAKGKWDELEGFQEKIVAGVIVPDSGEESQDGDDLKMIEGIGANAAKALNKAGIISFEELSEKTPDELKAILDQHGYRFAGLDPGSWPQQAWLAASGRWEDLEELQDQLTGGKYATTPLKDDLKRVEGIGPKVEGVLNNAGIHTWEDLSKTEPTRIREILDDAGNNFAFIDPSSWSEQAQLAADGSWEELEGLQDELVAGSVKQDVATYFSPQKDDLKQIEGIGPKIESVLNNAGIQNFEQLASTDPNRLRNLLDNTDPRYRITNPNSWPNQAKLAYEGKWDELYDLQDELVAGRITNAADLKQIEGIGPKVENLLQGSGIKDMEQLAATDPARLKSILNKAGNRYSFIDPTTWPEQAKLAKEGKMSQLNDLQDQIHAGAFASTIDSFAPDDLKRIEGIGPKIENLLNDEGITTWDDLANASPDRLKAILDKAGKRYQLHDPTSWPDQAALARDKKWTELDQLQEELIGGIRRKPLAQAAPLQRDDLKKVEGIGPKIESLLNDAGIFTWRQLADADINRLREILKAAGDRYRIHDPSTWPQQSALAAEGKWDELKQLQDILIGGREAK